MTTWVKGNHAFTSATTEWDLTGTSILIPTNLTEPQGAGGYLYIMFQPGILRGFNLYIGSNTSSTDMTVRFLNSAWNGDTSWTQSTYTLFTVTAGSTGYFCFDPNDLAESSRTWAARDRVGFQLVRTAGSGEVSNITAAVCYEITEEYMLDNDYPPNLALGEV